MPRETGCRCISDIQENRSAKIALTVGKKPLRPYGLGGLYSGTFSALWMGGSYRMRIVSVFVSVFA
jgi:hypothetical protein